MLQFLVPGYAWILVSGLHRQLKFFEKLSLSFLLSVCFSSLLTAGLSLLSANYMLYSPVVSIGISIIVAMLILAKRLRWTRPRLRLCVDRSLLLLFSVLCIYTVVLVSLYWSSPVYPTADSADPISHAELTYAIIRGRARTVLLQHYPTGLHFAGAILSSLLSLSPLQSLRVLLSLVLLDTLALIHFSACALLGARKLGSVTVLIAAFVLPVEAIHFIRIGTFTNILADAIVFAMLWLIFCYARQPSFALGSTLAFLGLAGLFIHHSFLLFLGALWISIPILFLTVSGKIRNYLEPVICSTLGCIVFLALSWPASGKSLQYWYAWYAANPPPLLTLQQMGWNFNAFVGPVNTVTVGLAIFLTAIRRPKAAGPMFAIAWMVLLIAATFFSSVGWRFVLFSLLPGTFLMGNVVGSGWLDDTTKNHASRKKLSTVLMAVVLIFLTASGGFLGILSRSYNPSGRARQQEVLRSMLWLMGNTGGGAVASVGLSSDYRYLPILVRITYVGDFDQSAEEMLRLSSVKGFSFVAVSTSSSRLDSFETNLLFCEEYRSDVVVIFSIRSLSV